MNDRGVFKVGDGDEPKWICAPLHVVAYARTAEKEEWGKLLKFADPENCTHEWLLPLSLLAKDTAEFRGRLLSLGLKISPVKGTPELLRQYLQATEPGVFALTVDRIAGCPAYDVVDLDCRVPKIQSREGHFKVEHGTATPTLAVASPKTALRFHGK